MVFHVWVALILNIVILSDWHDTGVGQSESLKELLFRPSNGTLGCDKLRYGYYPLGNMGERNLNLELFVVVSWMNSWVSPFIIPDIICFGFFTLDTRMVKFFMKLGVKFHPFFSRKRVKFLSLSHFSRNESEMKMTGNRDQEVKVK